MILILYILRHHFTPFLFSSVSLVFIFVLQFLMRYADRLIGKGIDPLLIVQLIMYNLAWMLVLVVPMAVLIATLMAFGGMSQSNEVTVMRASGISVYRMISAPFICSIGIAYLLILFNNDVLPDANHKAKTLMQDISQKKPTLSLEPNLFSQDIPNFAILVRDIDQQTNILYGVTMYDYSDNLTTTIITAKEGKLYFSNDQTKLIMDLHIGEIHEPDDENRYAYRKIEFTNHRIMMDGSQFSFQESTPTGNRGDRELSAADMLARVDSFRTLELDQLDLIEDVSYKFFYGDSLAPEFQKPQNRHVNIQFLFSQAIQRIESAKNSLVSLQLRLEYLQQEQNKYLVETHKKYSIPFACIVFILIGPPLGMMMRKGGFGMAASVSLFFFLIYWAFLIGGEKLADRGFVTPFWGMWAANILMALIGMYLIYKTSKQMMTLDFSKLKKLIPKRFRATSPEQNENS